MNRRTAKTPTKPAAGTRPARPDEGKYVYAIIESEEPRTFGNLGIGGRRDIVHTVH